MKDCIMLGIDGETLKLIEKELIGVDSIGLRLVAIISNPNMGLIRDDLEYYMFDCGKEAAKLGGRIITMFNEQKIKKILKIPDFLRIIALVESDIDGLSKNVWDKGLLE